jgi:hypothetical protein
MLAPGVRPAGLLAAYLAVPVALAGCGGGDSRSREDEVAAALSKAHANVKQVTCTHLGGQNYSCDANVDGARRTLRVRAGRDGIYVNLSR